MTSHATAGDHKLAYRMDEAAHAVGLSRATLYRLIEKGELAAFKIGARTLIQASTLHAFIESKQSG